MSVAAPTLDLSLREKALAGLVAGGVLDESAAARVRWILPQGTQRLTDIIIGLGLVSDDVLADALGVALGLERLSELDAASATLDESNVSRRFQDAHRIAVFRDSAKVLQAALTDPTDEQLIEALCFAVPDGIALRIATQEQVQAVWRRSDAGLEEPADRGETASDDADLERLRESASDAPVVRLVNDLIAGAVGAGASDIHIEPGEARLIVRYRLDGVLREMHRLPVHLGLPVISRIKIMASLDIGERRLPQDGAIAANVRGRTVDLRVATMPAVRGEAAVIRVLNRARVALDLSKLGFDDGLVADLEELLKRPNGIFLVTGPTGSGKSTTLYAMLQKLNTGTSKILTIEDPVEFQIEGINQVQAKPEIGLTFARTLRAMLRHDPDIIMVGEIRDAETAEIAVQAALTGHLVLASLHTNSAAAAIVRLLDMGIEDYLIASTLNGVLAQRLARHLCGACAVRGADGAWMASGCAQCAQTGYAGRMPVGELLSVSSALRRLIAAKAPTAELEAQARADGMAPLDRQAARLVEQGLTSESEARRAVYVSD